MKFLSLIIILIITVKIQAAFNKNENEINIFNEQILNFKQIFSSIKYNLITNIQDARESMFDILSSIINLDFL